MMMMVWLVSSSSTESWRVIVVHRAGNVEGGLDGVEREMARDDWLAMSRPTAFSPLMEPATWSSADWAVFHSLTSSGLPRVVPTCRRVVMCALAS